MKTCEEPIGNAKGGKVPDVGDIGIRKFEGDGDFPVHYYADDFPFALCYVLCVDFIDCNNIRFMQLPTHSPRPQMFFSAIFRQLNLSLPFRKPGLVPF